MPRYIDADDAKSAVKANEWTNPIVPISVGLIIDRVPTADVAPVVHAHWVYEGIFYGNAEYTCSRCHRTAVVSTSVKRNHIDAVYPYCHCGAKMDEEVEK